MDIYRIHSYDDPRFFKQFCISIDAIECTRNTTRFDLSKYDVSIFIPQPLPDGPGNHVGMACYTAICSKLLKTNLSLKATCFIGGVNMNGSLFFDETTLAPLMRAMKARGITTVYAPMGTSRLVNPRFTKDCNILILEAPDAGTLVSMAVSVKPPRGLNCGSGHETISQNLKYLSCSPREVFDTLGDGQKWSKVCK